MNPLEFSVPENPQSKLHPTTAHVFSSNLNSNTRRENFFFLTCLPNIYLDEFNDFHEITVV